MGEDNHKICKISKSFILFFKRNHNNIELVKRFVLIKFVIKKSFLIYIFHFLRKEDT